MERQSGSSADVYSSSQLAEIELPVIGMYCANCARAVERALLKKTGGVESASVNYATEQVHVRYDPGLASLDKLAEAVQSAGYRLVLPDIEQDPADLEAVERRRESEKQKRALLVGLMFTVPLFLLSMARDWNLLPVEFSGAPGYRLILFLLATPVQFYTGQGYYLGAWTALRNRTSNMDVLVALGSTTAYLYSVVMLIAGGGHLYFETAALIITLIKLGKWLEIRARGQAGSAIRELLKRVPPTVLVLDEMGEAHEIPLSAVRPGELIRIRPGDTVPVDGVVDSGHSTVDASLLTGESMPLEAEAGDEVFGGTINLRGTLVVRVMRPGSDSAVARIIKRVKAAQGSKAPIQRLADRVAAVFVPVIVAIALATLGIWLLISGSVEISLVRMVAVLVIACPCAMGLATPTAIITGMGAGAKSGILYRDAEAVEAGAKLKLVAFDKTGTLTAGLPELHTVFPLERVQERELLESAASALKNSTHPLAQAAARRAKQKGVPLHDTAMFEEEPGFGVRSMLDNGKIIRVGKPEAFEDVPEALAAKVEALRAAGETVSLVSDRCGLIGALGFLDTPRPEAAEAVASLKKQGLRVAMLSGDHHRIAEVIARQVGIEDIHAELLPEQKEDEVVKLRQQVGGGVAVVGDGINDAPALTRADLGIAVGSGSDVAIESAGITLPSDDIRGVPRAIKLSRRTVAVIKQNLFWAFFYNVALVPVAAGVLSAVPGAPPMLQQLHPAFAAGAMAVSSVTVVMNSLRLKGKTGG